MKKALFFLPAAAYTLAAMGLNIVLHTFVPLWYGWAALLWLGGWFLARGKPWGGLIGLVPAVHLLYMSTRSTGQVVNIELPLGLVTAVYVGVCIGVVWKHTGQINRKK